MTEYSCQQRYESPDRQSAVTIEAGDHGLHRYTVWKWVAVQGDGSEFDFADWVPSRESGLYADSGEAKAAAKADVDWLQS